MIVLNWIHMIRYFLLTTILLFQLPLISQKRAAQKLLDQMSEKFEAFESFELLFDLETTYPDRPVLKQRASIIQSGIRFMFISEEQEIIGDGEDVYLYLKDRNEIQINDFDEDEELGLITPRDFLNQYRSNRFEYDIESQSDTKMIIVFKPLDRESEYSKYRITINKVTKDFESIDAYGKDGTRVLASINESYYNRQYPIDFFTFNPSKYTNVKIEDLRID